jgi:serine/threonine-protein kinase
LAALACASVAIGVLALAGSAVAKPAQPRQSRTYIGTVRGTNAFAAIVVRRGVGIAYVCDGKKISVWLKGKFSHGKVHLASKAGDTLDGTFGHATLDLTNRKPLTVKTKYSPFDDKAHLFIGKDTIDGTTWAGGWITLLDGRQRGSLKTGAGRIFASPTKVTPTTTSVTVPGGGTLGVEEYIKSWDKIPATEGGAAS